MKALAFPKRMCWVIVTFKHPSCIHSVQDLAQCPDTMHDIHAALTWQQGWRLGVETPPVLLEASPVLLLLLLPGSLQVQCLAWVCQQRCL